MGSDESNESKYSSKKNINNIYPELKNFNEWIDSLKIGKFCFLETLSIIKLSNLIKKEKIIETSEDSQEEKPIEKNEFIKKEDLDYLLKEIFSKKEDYNPNFKKIIEKAKINDTYNLTKIIKIIFLLTKSKKIIDVNDKENNDKAFYITKKYNNSEKINNFREKLVDICINDIFRVYIEYSREGKKEEPLLENFINKKNYIINELKKEYYKKFTREKDPNELETREVEYFHKEFNEDPNFMNVKHIIIRSFEIIRKDKNNISDKRKD